MITARNWREIPQRYRLEAGKCDKCGDVQYPPKLVCPKCQARSFKTIKLTGEGKILTYSTIHVAPTGFGDDVPYVVAIVEMDEGAKMMAQVVDCEPEDVTIGARVRTEFRRIQEDGDAGAIFYGHKFVPARTPSPAR